MHLNIRTMTLTGLLAIAGLVAFDSEAQARGRKGGGCNGCNGYSGCWGGGSGCYGSSYGGGCWGSHYASSGCWGSHYAASSGCWGSHASGGWVSSGYASAPVYSGTTTVSTEGSGVVPASYSTPTGTTVSGPVTSGVYYAPSVTYPSGAVYYPSGSNVIGASYSYPAGYSYPSGYGMPYGGYPAYGGTYGSGFISGVTGMPMYYGGYSPASYVGYQTGRRLR